MDNIYLIESELVSVVFLGIGGCAFAPVDQVPVGKYTSPDSYNEFTKLSKESAMDIARSALQSSGYEVIGFVPELGEVRSKSKGVLTPTVCDCGSWNGNVITGTADSLFVINVKSQPGGGSSVKATFTCATTFSGKNLYGAVTRMETYACASRGTTENQFWEKFREIDMVRKQ